MNFFNQGLPLGRWFGITVVLHWTFLIFAGFRLLGSSGSQLVFQVMWMALLFLTVLLHEFGHALSCKAVGGDARHIVLWPLGGIAFVQPPPKAWAWLVTTVCGPLVNAILWPVFWAIGEYWALPYLDARNASWPLMDYLALACLIMAEVNRLLLLFNLIPAYPMDGGRILQELLWITVGYRGSLMIAGMIGTVAGGAFIAIGLGFYAMHLPLLNFTLGEKGVANPLLAIIGLMCCMESLAIYRQALTIGSGRQA